MIYLDHNASAPVRPEVAELLKRAFEVETGNPSSVHRAGRAARLRLDQAREKVARAVGAPVKDVAFTASGSESNAIALKGAWAARADVSKRRIVSSAIEHPSSMAALEQLEREGAEVIRVKPRADGQVRADAFLAEVNAGTALATLMWVNNETGVIQPVHEVARACNQRGVPFHCDAVQAAGRVRCTLQEVPADLLSLSGHKLGAPAGCAALIGRRALPVASLVPGHQEDGRRGGTQAVAMAEAFALALELSQREVAAEGVRLDELRGYFEAQVRARVARVSVNGEGAPRAPGTSNLRFEGADGEAVLIALDLEGICVSSGAACASGSLKPSHVLLAMGLSSTQAQESLRFSFGRTTTKAELDAVVDALARAVKVRG
ncbi:MAG: cysteine desulfurase family protein [Myxococcaceae bacterium]